MKQFPFFSGSHSSIGVWLWIAVFLFAGFESNDAIADIVTLKDGTTLRCQMVDPSSTPGGDSRFLPIRIGQSVIWLNRTAVERIESSPVQEPLTPEIEALVKRLLDEGILVSAAEETETKEEPPTLHDQEIGVRVKEIRGWAYAYENEKAREDGIRTALSVETPVPIRSILVVSPNTRLTLDIPGMGEIGLEAGAEICFDDVSRNRSRRSYALSLRIDQGRCWLRIRSQDRVILSLNSVRCIPQNNLLYIQSAGKTGAIDITYLKGDNDLKFSRNRATEAPYIVNQGQVLHVDPGVNRLPVENASLAAELQQRIDSWADWQPEPLVIELGRIIPPLVTFPSFRALPALHPYRLTIDSSLLMPPETRSLGEILDTYRQALERYRLETGRYPSFDHGLEALWKSFDVPGWKGPYIPLDLPRRDPWNNPFVYDLYTEKGRSYPDVRSNGQNGKDDKGLGDDIR